MKKEIMLSAPSMPNFVGYEVNGKRLDGTNIDIADFTESEAREYAEFMKEAFMEHWKKRRIQLRNENKKPA